METENDVHKMYDVHMHIIPGVDDGSWNQDMSYFMLYMAYMQGIRKIIATPHSEAFDYHPELVETAFGELKKLIGEKIPGIELYQGCEVHCRKENMKNILEKLQAGIYLTLNHTRYVLTEFSIRIEQEDALFCITALQNEGWIPVVAHVERYKNLFTDEKYLEALKETGCLMQINVSSVVDEYNEKIKQNALRLVERRQADFLGTDAHRMNHRPPDAENGLKFLYSHFDAEYIDRIAFGNAEQFLLV